MKNKFKFGLLLVILVIITSLGFGIQIKDRSLNEDFPLSLILAYGDMEEVVKAYRGSDDVFYFLLPGNRDHYSLRWSDEGTDFVVDGREAGYDLSEVMDGRVHLLENRRARGQYRFSVLQGDKTAAVFVSTAADSLEELLNDKSHKEPVRLMYADDLSQQLFTDVSIKGHGNVTWLFDKKSYNLIFDDAETIGGIADRSRWVLLSNSVDSLNIRNVIAYKMGRDLGLKMTRDYRYVDLYINGQYRGLYLLTPKVDVLSEEWGINHDELYVCSFELEERLDKQSCGVILDSSQPVSVVWPESSCDVDYVRDYLNKVERCLTDQSGDGLKLSEVLDIDSWARRFLIDEFTGNLDAASTSSYMYWKKGEEGEILYVGPLWDYDMTLGNSIRNMNPNSIMTVRTWQSPSHYAAWYKNLMGNDDFRQYVNEIYFKDFRNYVLEELVPELDEIDKEKGTSALFDEIRWGGTASSFAGKRDISLEEVKDYIRSRIDFLDEYLPNYDEYCLVQIEVNGEYVPYTVHKGGSLDLSTVEKDMNIIGPSIWINEDNQSVYSSGDAITENIRLRLQNTSDGGNYDMRTVLLIMIILVVLSLGIVLLFLDHRVNFEKRK